MVDKIRALRAHPVHPLILAVPIVALATTMAADAVFMVTQSAQSLQVAFWSNVIGVVTGTLGMLPVIIDFFRVVVGTRAEAITVMHMFFHAGAMIFFTLAALLLWNTNLTLSFFAFGLQTYGFMMLLLGAVLAGEMMQRRLFASAELQKGNEPERATTLVG